jgi:hypothetical protein
MRCVLVAVALLAIPATSQAVGFGTTAFFGTEEVSKAGRSEFGLAGPGTYPSLDLVFGDRLYLQTSPLELIQGLREERLVLGARLYYGVANPNLSSALAGLVALGGSFDLLTRKKFDNSSFLFQVVSRIGFQFGEQIKAGIFIVPGIGFAIIPDPDAGETGNELNLAFTGQLQLSVWLP